MRSEKLGMIKKLVIISLIMGMTHNGLLGAQESGQAPMRISPDEAVNLAIKNNLILESARVSNATRKRASDYSWNQFVPSVTISGAFTFDNEKPPPPISIANPMTGEELFKIETPRWGLAFPIQTSLNLSMAMFENMNRLKLDYQGGLISYEKAKLQLERDLRKAYNSMLLLQENISLLKDNIAAAERRMEMARANYRAGLSPELMYLQTQVAVENLKPIIDQAENGLLISMASFAMNLGLPYDTQFELLPVESDINFISLDVQELVRKAATGKPDIQELRHNILLLQSVRKTQSNALLPSLNLSWGITPYTTPPIETMNRTIGGWGKTGSLTIALGLRLHSLFPFVQDRQGIKDIDDMIASTNIGLSQLIQGTEIEIYNIVLSLNKTQITAESQAQTIRLAERSYQLTEQAYRAGLQDLLQVQNAELELEQAKLSMLEQQFNYLNGILDLEYSIGVPYGTILPRTSVSGTD